MTQITLDRESADRLRAAGRSVELLDPDGAVPATATPSPALSVTAEEIAAAKAASEAPGPRVTFAEAWEKIYAKHGRPADVSVQVKSGVIPDTRCELEASV